MLCSVLFRWSLQIMVALPDQEQKCLYHNATEN